MRATIDWSYNLLDPDERTLFQRLGVFSSGLSLEAAEAVGAATSLTAPHFFRLLSSLVNRSPLLLTTAKLEQMELLEREDTNISAAMSWLLAQGGPHRLPSRRWQPLRRSETRWAVPAASRWWAQPPPP